MSDTLDELRPIVDAVVRGMPRRPRALIVAALFEGDEEPVAVLHGPAADVLAVADRAPELVITEALRLVDFGGPDEEPHLAPDA